MTSKDLATYAYISNNSPESVKPAFEEELSDDQISFKENMRKGYLTRDEAIYYGSKQFDLEEVAVKYE